MRPERISTALCVGLSFVALSIAFAALLLRGPGESHRLLQGISGELGELTRRCEGLEDRLLVLERRPAAPVPGSPAQQPAPEPGADEPMKRTPALPGLEPADAPDRLEALERSVEELDKKLRRVVIQGGVRVETPEENAAIVQEAQVRATDASLDSGERLRALRALRARDGRTREVVQAMLEVFQDPRSAPSLRADIIRNLHGTSFEELKLPLLEALADPDAETRSEVVETLEAFYDDPRIHEAIVRVRDGDPDTAVREEAKRRLEEHRRHMESGSGR